MDIKDKNRLIYGYLDAKVVRKGVDVNIYIGENKVLKMGTWTEKQAWEAATNPKIENFNNSWSRLLPVFFKIVKERGKDHSVSQELMEMLLTENIDKFYKIVVDYIMAEKSGYSF